MTKNFMNIMLIHMVIALNLLQGVFGEHIYYIPNKTPHLTAILLACLLLAERCSIAAGELGC